MNPSGSGPRKKKPDIKLENNAENIEVLFSNSLSIKVPSNLANIKATTAVAPVNKTDNNNGTIQPKFSDVPKAICDVMKKDSLEKPVNFAEDYLKKVFKEHHFIEPFKFEAAHKEKLTEAENVLSFYYSGNRKNDLKKAWENLQGSIRKSCYDIMKADKRGIICAYTSNDEKFYYLIVNEYHIPYADKNCTVQMLFNEHRNLYGIPNDYKTAESIYIINPAKENGKPNILKLDVKTGYSRNI